MKTNIFSRIALATVLTAGALSLGSCDDFLDHQKPQGTLDETQVKDPSRIDNGHLGLCRLYVCRRCQLFVLNVELRRAFR